MLRVGFNPSLGNTAGLLVAAPGKGSAAGRGGEGARHTGGLFGGRCLSAEASDSGRPGNHGRGGKAGSPRRARRGPRVTGPRGRREGGGRARPGAVTAAPPRSYLGGAARGDALPAGSRRRAGRTGSAPLPRRRAGCQSAGGPGHYPGAAAGPAGAGRGRAVPPGPPLGVWQRGAPMGPVLLRIKERGRGTVGSLCLWGPVGQGQPESRCAWVRTFLAPARWGESLQLPTCLPRGP